MLQYVTTRDVRIYASEAKDESYITSKHYITIPEGFTFYSTGESYGRGSRTFDVSLAGGNVRTVLLEGEYGIAKWDVLSQWETFR